MTVSNVHTFTLTRDQIIQEALELTASIDLGATIPAEVVASCARTLNLYIKAWQVKGLFLHTYQPATLTLVSAQEAYLLGPGGTAYDMPAGTVPIIRPLKITDVRMSGTETPLTRISMDDYMGLTLKTSSGPPSQYAFDPQLDNAVMYVWPSPSAADTVLFNYQRPVDDFTTDSDTATMPVDWLQAFTLGLAYHIAPKRMVPIQEQKALQARYEEALSAVGDFEEASFFIQPG